MSAGQEFALQPTPKRKPRQPSSSRRYVPLVAPKTRGEIAAQLRWLAEHAEDIAVTLEYYGGFAHWSAKGKELAGAAQIIREWAHEIATEVRR